MNIFSFLVVKMFIALLSEKGLAEQNSVVIARDCSKYIESMGVKRDLNLHVDLTHNIAYWNDAVISLTPLQATIVAEFEKAQGRVMSFQTLIGRVYPGQPVEASKSALASQLKRIRNLFRQADSSFSALRPIYKVGYQWAGDIPSQSTAVVLPAGFVFPVNYEFSDLQLDPRSGLVCYQGNTFSLSATQTSIVRLLLSGPQKRWPPESILRVIGAVRGSNQYLRATMWHLRRKFLRAQPSFNNIFSYRDGSFSWERSSEERFLVWGEASLDLVSQKVFWKGSAAELSRIQTSILYELLKAQGDVVLTEDLIRAVYPGRDVGASQDLLRAQVSRIRRIFGQLDLSFSALRSFFSMGYRWVDDTMDKPLEAQDLNLFVQSRSVGIDLNPQNGLVRYKGRLFRLGPTQAKLLRCLLLRPSTKIKKDDLIEACWEDAGATDEAFNAAILRLRKSFESIQPGFEEVITNPDGTYSWGVAE